MKQARVEISLVTDVFAVHSLGSADLVQAPGHEVGCHGQVYHHPATWRTEKAHKV